jgi:hypothetical protein
MGWRAHGTEPVARRERYEESLGERRHPRVRLLHVKAGFEKRRDVAEAVAVGGRLPRPGGLPPRGLRHVHLGFEPVENADRELDLRGDGAELLGSVVVLTAQLTYWAYANSL